MMIISCTTQTRGTRDLTTCVEWLRLHRQIHRHFILFLLRTQSEILAALAGYRLECRSK